MRSRAVEIATRAHEILKKLGCGTHACHQQIVSCPRARHVQQVPLCPVDVFEVGLIGGAFDSTLQRDHFLVAGHHRDRAKLQALGEVHGHQR